VRCSTFSPASEHRQNVADASREANLLFVKMSNELLRQSAKTTNHYCPLDISRSEICLLSFANTAAYSPIRLKLLCPSPNDWEPDYVSFCDQNSSAMSSCQLSEAWSDRLATTVREINNTVTSLPGVTTSA
jgi:hypothetical protein